MQFSGFFNLTILFYHMQQLETHCNQLSNHRLHRLRLKNSANPVLLTNYLEQEQ
jgi:hypothetical protein